VWPVIQLFRALPSEIDSETFKHPALLFAAVAENAANFYAGHPAAPDKFFNFRAVGATGGAFAEKRFHNFTAPWVVMNW